MFLIASVNAWNCPSCTKQSKPKNADCKTKYNKCKNNNSIDNVMRIGEHLKLKGTPSIFNINGEFLGGYQDINSIKNRLRIK